MKLELFAATLAFTYILLFTAEIWVASRAPHLREAFVFYIVPIMATLTFTIAVMNQIMGRHILAGLYAFNAVTYAYLWWHNDNNRRRRKKLLDRAAGRVRDMGGRLVVQRPALNR